MKALLATIILLLALNGWTGPVTNLLTLEQLTNVTSLSATDLFFVRVNVGTTNAHDRKISVSNFVASLNVLIAGGSNAFVGIYGGVGSSNIFTNTFAVGAQYLYNRDLGTFAEALSDDFDTGYLNLGRGFLGFFQSNVVQLGPFRMSQATPNRLAVFDSNSLLTNATVGITNLPMTFVDNALLGWVSSELYQLTVIKRDANDVITNATVVWPDGTFGVFNTTSNDPTWLAVDAYTITYTNFGRTITQAAVIRNGNGAITNKPALTIQ